MRSRSFLLSFHQGIAGVGKSTIYEFYGVSARDRLPTLTIRTCHIQQTFSFFGWLLLVQLSIFARIKILMWLQWQNAKSQTVNVIYYSLAKCINLIFFIMVYPIATFCLLRYFYYSQPFLRLIRQLYWYPTLFHSGLILLWFSWFVSLHDHANLTADVCSSEAVSPDLLNWLKGMCVHHLNCFAFVLFCLPFLF